MRDREELGRRLKEIAEGKGLSPYEIARRMTTPERTVYAPTIYDWWRGRHRPSPKNLRRYAEVMETTMEEINSDEAAAIAAAEVEERATEMAISMVQEMLVGVVAGQEPAKAHGRILGEGMPADLSRALARHAPLLRQLLNQMAGGDFLQQSSEEQLRIVRILFHEGPPSIGDEPSL